jgi:hypothetical protein
MPAYIYGLYDPQSDALRYVGCTNNLKLRIRNHLSKAKECLEDFIKCNPFYYSKHYYNNKDRWIASLLRDNRTPKTDVLAIIEVRENLRRDVVEASLIRYLCHYHDLLNERHNTVTRDIDLKYDYHLSEELKHQRRYYH